ncbi:MAG: hypothetical protein R2845_05840 [Thermomicrobiales bacterium]
MNRSEALEEAIHLMKDLWNTDERGGVKSEGKYYAVNGQTW